MVKNHKKYFEFFFSLTGINMIRQSLDIIKPLKFWKELTSVKTSQTVIHLPQRKVKNDQRRLDFEKY